MLYFPTNIPGIVKVSYDEPSSTLFIWYTYKKECEAWKINEQYYHSQILPLIDAQQDFRTTLIYAQRSGFAEKVVNATLVSQFDVYEK